jgi:hypothetical protein
MTNEHDELKKPMKAFAPEDDVAKYSQGYEL